MEILKFALAGGRCYTWQTPCPDGSAKSRARSAAVDELTPIRTVVRYLPTLVVVLVLLDLLVEEYLRLMELAGLVRRTPPLDQNTETEPDVDDAT